MGCLAPTFNKKLFTKLFGSIGMAVIASGIAFQAPQALGEADLRPAWSTQDSLSETANMSFLNDLNHEDVWNPLAGIVDGKRAAEMRQAAEDLNRSYNLRCTYGLEDPFSDYYHQTHVNDFGHDLINQVVAYHVVKDKDKMDAIGEREPALKSVAIVGGGAAAVWIGKPFGWDLDDSGTRLIARTSIRQQIGEVEVNSSLLNAGISVNMSKPETRDPTLPPMVDPTQKDERYKVSVSRGLPVFDLSSRLSYGSTSNTVSAGLSKPLMEHLTAEVTAVRPAPINRTASSAGEEVVKFSYGVTF